MSRIRLLFFFPSFGVVEVPASPAVHVLSRRKSKIIKNSLAISFNVSQTWGHDGIIRYALLRVHREPVDVEMLAHLTQRCGSLSKFKLRLFTQIEDGSQAYKLVAAKPLPVANLTEGEWVEFWNITKLYAAMVKSIQKELGEDKTHMTKVLRTRLQLKTPSCGPLSPSVLGFSSVAEHKAQLVGVEETTIDKDLTFSKVMSMIARQQYLQKRSRRQVTEETTSMEGQEEDLHLATAAPSTSNSTHPQTPRHHQLHRVSETSAANSITTR